MLLNGCTPYRKEDTEKYDKMRWWAGLTFGDLIDKAADIYPEKEAFVDRRSRLTFAQMRERVNRFAIRLIELGVKPTERVLLQIPNWNEFVCAYFGIQKAGAIPVSLIDRYRQYEINHLARLTDATHWVVAQRYKKVYYPPIIEDVLRDNPQIRNVILARPEREAPFMSLENLIEEAGVTDEKVEMLAARRPDPMQVGHMAPTGGTTGLPKLVPHTHNNYLCRVEYSARRWELSTEDICLAVAPVGHDLIFISLVCATIFAFGKLVMLDSSHPQDICETIQSEKITATVWVPTLAQRLINFEGLDEYDLSTFKKMYCSGGASSPGLIRTMIDRLGCIYLNGYGGTEGMLTLTGLNDDLDSVCETVGRPCCPYDTYKVVDENGKRLPANKSGELVVKGPTMFTGYYMAPEENAIVFDGDGFFKTGDIARIDETGRIKITGRIKEMVNRGGESISATEIENLISEHPDVAIVAVIPMPDPEMEEKVCAFIQPKPQKVLSFEEVISFLKAKKASVLQFPEHIEFVKQMPLTKAGKLDKKALKKAIMAKIRSGFKTSDLKQAK